MGKKKLNIAMIGHKRIPGREGGVEVVVQELATRMAERGHNVTAYNRFRRGVKKTRSFQNVRIKTIPTINQKSLDAVIYSFFASICVSFSNADIIHYHAIGPSAMLVIPHAFTKKKIVVTVHGLNYKTPKWKGFGAKYLRWAEKMVAKYADQIITLSKEQQKYFKNKYNRETVFIPNGTIVENFESPDKIKEKWNLEKDSYILFVSRVVPGKGLETLIQAFKNIDTDKRLIIAGGSEYVSEFRNDMEKLASVDSRIEFIGFVNGKTLRELYSNAFLFVFPSEAEGMPMCLLEALSFNTPTLVSNIPENVEVGKEFVQSFEVGNTDDLQEKLESCINNRTSLFQKNSREYVCDYYDWDKVVERTLELYDGLL